MYLMFFTLKFDQGLAEEFLQPEAEGGTMNVKRSFVRKEYIFNREIRELNLDRETGPPVGLTPR